MIQKTLNDCAKKTFVSLISQLAKLRDRELELPTILAQAIVSYVTYLNPRTFYIGISEASVTYVLPSSVIILAIHYMGYAK